MKFKIREIKPTEYHNLKNFLYETIFILEGVEVPSKSIVEKPDLQVYTKIFADKVSVQSY